MTAVLEVPRVALTGASVDNRVAETLDDAGNYLRDSVEVTRLPDRPDSLGPLLALPVNHGAGYNNVVELGGRQIEPVHDPAEERWTEEFVRDLMRHPVPGGPRSSGSGGRRRSKPSPVPATHANQQVALPGRSVSSYRISALSRGVLDFYDRRPGADKMVLRAFVGELIRDRTIVEPRCCPLPRSGRPIIVFGLEEHELTILRRYRNAARIALATYARANDRGRILAVDRS